MLARLRQLICENRRLGPFAWAGAAAERYLHAYYNEDCYDFRLNGELFVVKTFAAWRNCARTIAWDVGANRGQWVLEAVEVLPSAEFHSFEIVPDIYDVLVQRLQGLPNVHAHGFGLSDSVGQTIVHVNPNYETTSSISPRLCSEYFTKGAAPVVCEICEVSTADCLAERLGKPHLIKIDVEGHEVSVLRGAQALLASSDGPEILQLEYGETYLPSGSTLKNIYDLLQPHGYALGRLYPNHVDFRPYAYADDNFRMGNFIAVKPPKLKAMLAG
jgi:FkbM family methyltransferase